MHVKTRLVVWPINENNRRTILDFVLSFNLRKILLMIGAILKLFLELLI